MKGSVLYTELVLNITCGLALGGEFVADRDKSNSRPLGQSRPARTKLGACSRALRHSGRSLRGVERVSTGLCPRAPGDSFDGPLLVVWIEPSIRKGRCEHGRVTAPGLKQMIQKFLRLVSRKE